MTHNSINIRLPRVGELPYIEKLVVNSFTQFKNDLPKEIWDEWIESSSQAIYEDVSTLYVAECGGKIYGVVKYIVDAIGYFNVDSGKTARALRMLAVDQAERKKGIGRALVETCLERARKEGAEIFLLETGNFMKAAISLYTKLGFIPIKNVKVHEYTCGDSAKVYEMKL